MSSRGRITQVITRLTASTMTIGASATANGGQVLRVVAVLELGLVEVLGVGGTLAFQLRVRGACARGP